MTVLSRDPTKNEKMLKKRALQRELKVLENFSTLLNDVYNEIKCKNYKKLKYLTIRKVKNILDVLLEIFTGKRTRVRILQPIAERWYFICKQSSSSFVDKSTSLTSSRHGNHKTNGAKKET